MMKDELFFKYFICKSMINVLNGFFQEFDVGISKYSSFESRKFQSRSVISSQTGACSARLSLTLVAIPACTTLFDEQFTPLRVNKIMFEVDVPGSYNLDMHI